MTQNQTHFDGFEPHTLLKHAVLKAYLETWARKLLLRSGASDQVCIVDACAGTGCDKNGNPGSPVLAAEVANSAELQLRREFNREIRVRVVAIEKKPSHYRELTANLAPHGERARALRGTLADHIGPFFEEFGDTPTLFFIDPFGLAPLSADVIQRALSGGPRNEVLLLFADQAALRHFGAATAVLPDLEEEVAANIPAQGSLFEDDADVERRVRETLQARVEAKIAGQELTRPAAIRIMDSAFGGDSWRDDIQGVEPSQRRARVLELYQHVLRRLGATHVLPLPMRNDRDQLVYHLLHATKSAHGYTAMKEVISGALRRAPLTTDVVETMRFAISSDLDRVEERVRQKFAGRRIRWSADDSHVPTLRKFVLEETEAFPFELDELKKRLKKEKDPGKGPFHYTFQPSPPE